MAVSAVVVAEMFYLVNSRYFFRSVLSPEGLFGNRYVLIAIAACAGLQIAFTHTAALQAVFGSTDLSPGEWLRVVLAGVLVFSVAEVEKAVMRAFHSNRRSRPAAARGALPSKRRGAHEHDEEIAGRH